MSKIMQKLNRRLFTKKTTKYESDNSYILIENLKDILYLISLLRQRINGLKIKKINELIINEIDFFSSTFTKSNSMNKEEINKAKYLICAAFDEAYAYFCEEFDKDARYVTLISHYYNEEFGGDNFFKLLEDLYIDPIKNLHMLRLSYLLLSLGFEGKYAIKENGVVILEEIRIKLQSEILKAESQLSIKKNTNRIFKLEKYKFFKPKLFFSAMFILIFVLYLFCFIRLHDDKLQLQELIKKYYL